MQDRCTGDIGDFGKLGLLRQLSGQGLRIGVNWYRMPDERHNGDGRHTGYLQARHVELLGNTFIEYIFLIGGQTI